MISSMIRIYPQDPTTWLTFHLGLLHIPIYFDISAHEVSLFILLEIYYAERSEKSFQDIGWKWIRTS